MRIRLLVAFCLLAVLSVKAQTGFHIGFFGMPQNTWIFNERDTEESRTNFQYKMTWGYAGMVKIGVNFADPIGIHLGLNYSFQGQKHTSQDTSGVTVLTKRDLSYIKIPLLLHINSEPGPVMLNMEFGPQIGFLQSAAISEDGTLLTLPFDAVLLYKPKDISITWAIGAQFNITDFLAFTLVHRGDYGFFDIEDKSFNFNGQPYYSSNRLRSNTATFGLMGGFNFCINPRGGGRKTNLFWR